MSEASDLLEHVGFVKETADSRSTLHDSDPSCPHKYIKDIGTLGDHIAIKLAKDCGVSQIVNVQDVVDSCIMDGSCNIVLVWQKMSLAAWMVNVLPLIDFPD